MTQQDKKWFMKTILAMLNTPYIWGGDDPSGFDCSGMVIEGLKVVGAMKQHEDMTANDLWNKYKMNEITAYPIGVATPMEGDLAFWFSGDTATHVAVCIDDRYCITADGGGKKTKTLQDAIEQNAFIKIRLINHRVSKPRIVRIFDEG